MKYCTRCGKEHAEDALICPGCGCETNSCERTDSKKEKRRMNKKQIILTVIGVVSLVAVIVAGVFVWNRVQIERVKDDLSGNTYTCYKSSYYSYTYEEYKFDLASNCTFSYYYSHMDKERSYEKDYKIEIKNGKVFLVFLTDVLEVQYNDYGEIKQLYDVDTDEIFD